MEQWRAEQFESEGVQARLRAHQALWNERPRNAASKEKYAFLGFQIERYGTILAWYQKRDGGVDKFGSLLLPAEPETKPVDNTNGRIGGVRHA